MFYVFLTCLSNSVLYFENLMVVSVTLLDNFLLNLYFENLSADICSLCS
jgi:hypothetical protein